MKVKELIKMLNDLPDEDKELDIVNSAEYEINIIRKVDEERSSRLHPIYMQNRPKVKCLWMVLE